MNRTICMKHAKRLALGLAVLALAATPSFAQTIDLCATTGTATMPDSSTVPIWGYVLGSTCAAGDASLPGPVLRATEGANLTIVLHNNLPVDSSFFAPGLRPDVPNDGSGMFTSEAASGGSVLYSFSNIKAGTYLYHSGTNITTQVPMGLYGALVVDVAAGQAYSDVTYAQDEVLVYSEIDPDLNADPANFGGARVINWSPRYFLINGEAYPAAVSVGTSQSTLLRFVNAGLNTVVPTLDGGLYMDLVAEDGNRYPQPFQQYGIELPAGKTIDAIVNPGMDGEYALYDRALHAGQLTYIQAGAASGAPTALDDGPYVVAEDTPADALTVALPGVLGNDSTDPPGGSLTAVLVSSAANGALALAADGSFTYTPDANFSGSDQFTYMANDGTLDSNVATVSITVTPVDDPPVANADSASTPPDVAVVIDVVANDTDPDGNLDPASVTIVVAAVSGAAVSNGDGTVTYTPNLGFVGQDSFDYQVCDLTLLCDTATVTVDVVNSPPVANADAATTPLNTAVIVDVAANDTDPDGNLDPTSVTIVVAAVSGAAVSNGDGTVTYTPNLDFAGTDTFDYQVCDTGALCANATVTITVENAAPFAADDFATVARNSGAADPANTFSVTANDSDSDGVINVATVDLDPALAGRQTSVVTSRGGTATVDNLGNVTYVPKRGRRGTDTFTYTVEDNLGAVSNIATVRINVL